LLTAWLLRLHRWVALVFALPLIVVIVTGLILSFEPAFVMSGVRAGSLDTAKLARLLAQHDPDGKARAITVRSYAGALTIGGGRQGGPTIDIDTGAKLADAGTLANVLQTSRRMHETLLLEARWLVTTSTIAMLGLILLGVLMGLPRFRNTLAGWHKGIGWCLLPLLILSPLTGLALAFGITLTPPVAPVRDQPSMSLAEAIGVVGREHDLSNLIWLRPRGGQMLARLVENGEYRVYAVTPDGAVPAARNWPRLLHEGNWGGLLSVALNALTALALTALVGTGLFIWARRKIARRVRTNLATQASR
jgi:uncharacterized iron-regulated membrane protein